MTGRQLPVEKTSQKACFFRPQAACSFLVGLMLLGGMWIGVARTGVSQQPQAASGKQGLISSPATSDPLISLPNQQVEPHSLDNKLAQGVSKRQSVDSKSANKNKRGNEEQRSPEGARIHAVISDEQESAVRSFVKQHHPELAEVLESLKHKHSQAYARAIADLNRVRDRLEQLQSRDEVRYERELAMWKTKSRIQLLVVRIKMNPDDAALRAEFKSLISQQVEQHREQLLAEQQRIQQRLEKIEEQLEKLSENSDQLIEKQMRQWLASGDYALRKQSQKGGNPKNQPTNRPQQAKHKANKSGTVPVRTENRKDAEP